MGDSGKNNPFVYNKNTHKGVQRTATQRVHRSLRTRSISGLEGLVQCGICLEDLCDPRMLDCQHTFCLKCVKTTLYDQSTLVDNTSGNVTKVDKSEILCPTCLKPTPLPMGILSLDKLPGNLYIDSLLKLIQGQEASTEFSCVKCQIILNNNNQKICPHCSQVFCNVCWNIHMAELNVILNNLKDQLDDTVDRLTHKSSNFQDHCEQMKETIQRNIKEKIKHLEERENMLISELDDFKSKSANTADILSSKLDDLKLKISKPSGVDKVEIFLNYHKQASQLLNEISSFAESKIMYDSENYKLELCDEGIYNDLEISEMVGSPLEPSVKQYKSKSFDPKLSWSKCPRPTGIAIPPWDTSKLYIAAPDNRCVLIMNKERNKLVGKLIHDQMEYPCSVAFSTKTNEIFVSDKWKCCIHKFNKKGDHIGIICNKEIKSPSGIQVTSSNNLVIADSGNNRILIVNAGTGKKISEILGLNNPTGIALYAEHIIAADTGNHRIKTFDFQGNLLSEFGSLGKNPGQFRYAEAITVDHLGIIIVGDGGNARIQVFKPDGRLVKIFGSKGSFVWVSGLAVTTDFDIILTDHKERNLIIF